MAEPKYTPRTGQSEKGTQEQRESPKGTARRNSYEPPLCTDYQAIFGNGRFSTGEMIASARSWV
jgi:hypothetical protein